MKARLQVLGLLGVALAWAPFVGCDAFRTPAPFPPIGTGGVLGVGGVPATAGGSGGQGHTFLCPPPQEDCCYESLASYYCDGDSLCKSYHTATDCGRGIQCSPCLFGCLDGYCLGDPQPTGTGGGSLGGQSGLGGEGGLGGDGTVAGD